MPHGRRGLSREVYVASLNACGRPCPYGGEDDGLGCRVAVGPVGATAFLYDRGSGLHFYWVPRDGEPPCASPATYDGANCLVGAVAEGWEPLLAQHPHFYIEPVSCWPRKPTHMGEAGFSGYPNGQDLELSHYQGGDPRRLKKYQECVDDAGAVLDDVRPAGTEAEQVGFLLGNAGDSWSGLFPYTRACGFQGMHWWALGTVSWGICREDSFGPYAFWYLYTDAPPDGDELALTPPGQPCGEPPDLRLSPRRDEGAPHERFVGRVVDPSGAPVPLAMFYAWETSWGTVETFTDGLGHS